jgi:hypothetical protein
MPGVDPLEKRRVRFRLRTLLLIVGLCAIGAWSIALNSRMATLRRATLQELETSVPWARVSYSDERPTLFRSLFGDRLVREILLPPEAQSQWQGRLETIFQEAQIAELKSTVIDRTAMRRVELEIIEQSTQVDAGYSVRFVLPRGYSGVFTISEAQEAEAPLVFAPVSPDVEHTYVIPADGHLVTSNMGPLMSKFRAQAEYNDGNAISIDSRDDQCTYWRLPFVVDLSFRGMIGTEQDVENWLCTHDDWFTIEPE